LENAISIEGLSISFGGLKAVDNFDMEIKSGEIRSLIGPNGAGKTTIFNLITRIYKHDRGKILFYGEDISTLPPHRIAQKRIARTFQNVELIGELTALENVLVGCYIHFTYGLFSAALRLKKMRNEEKEQKGRALKALSLVGLQPFKNIVSSNIPLGQRRLLEIARALVIDPKLLLLDEPAAGMNALEIKELNRLLKLLREERGITILLVEHQMRMVMEVSDSITVLDYGQKIAEGTPNEIRNNPDVINAYLGKKESNAQN